MAVSGAAGLVYAVAHASGARADARSLVEEPAVLGRAVVMCVLAQGHPRAGTCLHQLRRAS